MGVYRFMFGLISTGETFSKCEFLTRDEAVEYVSGIKKCFDCSVLWDNNKIYISIH